MRSPPLERLLTGLAVVVWALALPIEPMDVDAAQYATMARELLERGDWLQLTNRGADYLDKPPLVFWLGALSYALFGVGTVASKLPSFAFALLGVVSTDRLGARLYDPSTGRLAALVLATTQALFLITNDCRTDTLLLGAVAFSLWQLVAFDRERTWRAFFGASLGLALALLAKGPIGLMVPLLALGTDVAIRREWKRILDPRWLLMAGLVGLLLAPMLWGLWLQFGERGPAFFLWTQSFGRLTGSNQWRNDTSPLFFTHTFLWSFLPWSLFAIAALASRFVMLARARSVPEAWTLGGFVLGFVGLSASRYKLPHYVFVLFPLAAVLTAAWLREAAPALSSRARLLWTLTQRVVLGAIALVVLGLCAWAFPVPGERWVLVAIAAGIGVGGLFVGARSRAAPGSWITPSVTTMLAANVLLSGHFYPTLLRYQSPARVAELGLDASALVTYRVDGYSLDFGVRQIVRGMPDVDAIHTRARNRPTLVYTDADGLGELVASDLRVAVVRVFEHFHVTMLNGTFLNPATRAKALQARYLVTVEAR